MWRRLGIVFLLGVAVGIVAWWPLWWTDYGPTSDGRYGYYQLEIGKAAIFHDHELPLWNPYDCRGLPMWDHPEAIIVSPVFLALLPLPTTWALLLWQMLHLGLGFTGLWLLVRDELGCSRLASAIASTIYLTYSGAAAQYAGLHLTLMCFYYVPLLIVLWRRAEKSLDATVGMGVVIALMFYEGATYAIPWGALILLAETLTRAHTLRRLGHIALRGLLAVVVATGLAACRLLPLAERLTQGGRDIPPDVDALLLHGESLWKLFTWRNPRGFTLFPNQQYWWHDHIIYLGVAGVLLLAITIPFAVRHRPWTGIVGAVTFLLMGGNFASWAPWSLLHAYVFPFHVLRVPSRFRHILILFLCAWIGIGIDVVPKRLSRFDLRRLARAILLTLAAAVIIDTTLLDWAIIETRFFGEKPNPQPPSPRFYYGGPGLTPDWMDQPSQHRAWLGCRASFYFHQNAPLWEGDVPQARAMDDHARVLSVSRTNNTFDLDVEADQPSRILVNSAYDKDWHSSVGTPMNHFDQLSVDLPAGRHHVHLWYWPRLLGLGFALTGLSVAGLVAYVALRHRRRQKADASTTTARSDA